MPSTELVLPTKACHNCRRRRWKCDRSLPVCQKCLSAGSECLGYGKLFVWNQGVASRGKMMGKSYEERLATKLGGGAQLLPASARTDVKPVDADDGRDGLAETTISARGADDDQFDNMCTVIHWALVDPLVKDLTPHSRYYLYHFATQLCKDIVIYDAPGQNPIRDLIPATSASPLLLQIILANSAFHVFNISREPLDLSAYQTKRKPCLVAYYNAVSRFGGPFKSSYRDALMAKQRALSLLARSVATVDESTIDLILATILLFVNCDLIESGKDKWKVHMEGARRLIHLLGTPSFHPESMSRLRTCLLSDFLVFYILGSTLSYSTTPNLIPDSIDLKPILRYAETNNYLSCPAPLLGIMLKSFDLSDLETKEFASGIITPATQDQIRELLEAALAFDPVAWAHNFRSASLGEEIVQRLHIASAHRSAVCIYLARLLPCTNPLLDSASGFAVVSLTGLADDIVHHISLLEPEDTLFKSISWPLFLAGAESEDPSQRTWILETLDSFYNITYWGYTNTVKKILEAIWTFKSRSGKGADNCWVDEIRDMGTEALIA